MSGTPFSTYSPTPSLRDAFANLKKEVMMSIKCHHIGTIQSFNATNQTAKATINYQQTFFKKDPTSLQYVPYLVPYPVLLDCPVICLGGGDKALTFPIAVGDECLVLFNDRDMDRWFAGTVNSGPVTPRIHSISDGLIIVGVRSLAHSLASYDTTRAVLRGSADGKTIVGVGETLIKIANASTTLGTVLTDILTALETFATAAGAATTAAQIATAAATLATAISPGLMNEVTELLE